MMKFILSLLLMLSVEVQGRVTNPSPVIASLTATATAGTTTASATPVVIGNMSVTVTDASTYITDFSAWFTHSANNADITISIYCAGVQQTHTIRTIRPRIQNGFTPTLPFSLVGSASAICTLQTGEVIDVRWSTTAATATVNNRTLNAVRLR